MAIFALCAAKKGGVRGSKFESLLSIFGPTRQLCLLRPENEKDSTGVFRKMHNMHFCMLENTKKHRFWAFFALKWAIFRYFGRSRPPPLWGSIFESRLSIFGRYPQIDPYLPENENARQTLDIPSDDGADYAKTRVSKSEISTVPLKMAQKGLFLAIFAYIAVHGWVSTPPPLGVHF
jgi:hypothetical protein